MLCLRNDLPGRQRLLLAVPVSRMAGQGLGTCLVFDLALDAKGTECTCRAILCFNTCHSLGLVYEKYEQPRAPSLNLQLLVFVQPQLLSAVPFQQ